MKNLRYLLILLLSTQAYIFCAEQSQDNEDIEASSVFTMEEDEADESSDLDSDEETSQPSEIEVEFNNITRELRSLVDNNINGQHNEAINSKLKRIEELLELVKNDLKLSIKIRNYLLSTKRLLELQQRLPLDQFSLPNAVKIL